MAFWVLLSVLLLHHNTGGLLGAQVRSFIIDGKDAAPHAWKSMAYLTYMKNDGSYSGCGATILSEQWVMTAASCWKIQPAPKLHRFTLSVGLIDTDKGEQYIGIDREPVIHGTDDLALFHTKQKIKMNKNVAVMSLPKKNNFDSSSRCWILGFGYVTKGTPPDAPQKLQERDISIVDCKDGGSDTLCAKDYACDGDYGGPMVCKEDNSIVQVGIMSKGHCDPDGSLGVYTPVFKNRDWIKQYIKNM